MMKRIFAFLLVIVLCLACFLTACDWFGKNKDKENKVPSEQQQQQEKAAIVRALNVSDLYSEESGESPMEAALAPMQDALDIIGRQINGKTAEYHAEAFLDEETQFETRYSAIVSLSNGVFCYRADSESTYYVQPFADSPYVICSVDDDYIEIRFFDIDLSAVLTDSFGFSKGSQISESIGMLAELPFDLPDVDDLEYRDGLYYIKDAYFIHSIKAVLFPDMNPDDLPEEYVQLSQMIDDMMGDLHLAIGFGVSQSKISRMKISAAPGELFFASIGSLSELMDFSAEAIPFDACSLSADLSIDVERSLPKSLALDFDAGDFGNAHIHETFHEGLPFLSQLTVRASVSGLFDIDASLSSGLSDGFPVSLTAQGSAAVYGVTLRQRTGYETYQGYFPEELKADVQVDFDAVLDLNLMGVAGAKPLQGSFTYAADNFAYYRNGVQNPQIPDYFGNTDKSVVIAFDSENHDDHTVMTIGVTAVECNESRSSSRFSLTVYPDTAPEFVPPDAICAAAIAKKDEAEQKLAQILADLEQSGIYNWNSRRFYIQLDENFYISFYANEYMENGAFSLVSYIYDSYYYTLEYNQQGQLIAVDHSRY